MFCLHFSLVLENYCTLSLSLISFRWSVLVSSSLSVGVDNIMESKWIRNSIGGGQGGYAPAVCEWCLIHWSSPACSNILALLQDRGAAVCRRQAGQSYQTDHPLSSHDRDHPSCLSLPPTHPVPLSMILCSLSDFSFWKARFRNSETFFLKIE